LCLLKIEHWFLGSCFEAALWSSFLRYKISICTSKSAEQVSTVCPCKQSRTNGDDRRSCNCAHTSLCVACSQISCLICVILSR
jgi:hypothetical protein